MKKYIKKDSIVVKRIFSKGGKQGLTIAMIKKRNNDEFIINIITNLDIYLMPINIFFLKI